MSFPADYKEQRETSIRQAKARVHLTAHVTASHAVEAHVLHGALPSYSYLFDMFILQIVSLVNLI